MILTNGARLGPYEIIAPLGAGGMGEVYRAKDTRLDRTVAVKVLASHLSRDPEGKQRFEREARAISSLSHPHICALYDVGTEEGLAYLVMELLEGETLTERLTKGPLLPAQVLRYGVEIAEALGAAHRRGIVHRDLKPGNVMLTKSGVKLLDFGLAKTDSGGANGATNLSEIHTKSVGELTGKGTILGTPQYMAPEQLEGKDSDFRTDIFALGTVLYEMATGKKAFTGKSQAGLISSILKDEPAPISRIQPVTPPALDHVVQKCLAKDPDDRWQTAQDVASELKWISEGSSQVGGTASAALHGRARGIVWKSSTLLFLVAALFLAFLHWRAPSSESRLMRFSVPAPEKSSFVSSIALSPDGRKLAFLALSNGRALLWVRSLDSLSAQALPGTEDAASPFWSPDGRWIAFFAKGKLKKIEASGGLPQILCDAADNRGGTWNRDGVILFSPSSSDGLYRVPADGGAAARSTKLDSSGSENSHRWPYFLPDGHHFLYLVLSGQPDKQGIFVGSLDSNESKRLLPSVSAVAYAPPGYLIFLSQATLMIQPFDSSRLQLKGQPVSVTEQVWSDSNITGLSAFSVSESGLLAYRSGGTQNNQFMWVDRNGNKLTAVGPPGRYVEPSFSADEKRIVFAISHFSGIGDLWTMDLADGNLSRFTFDPSDNATAVWSPDGERIVWTSNRSGPYDLYQKAASGAGKEELLLKSDIVKYPDDWSLDGRFILYECVDPKTRFDLWVLPMSGDHKPMPYLQTEFNETHARFSPDGRWVAYVSDESGRAEVYVQSFPATGGKWQISSGGGDQPLWRRDGKELFYVAADSQLMAAEVKQSSSTFHAGRPQPLLGLHIPPIGITSIRNYALVTADGKRFLVAGSIEDAASFPIAVILNWTSLLRR
jgi:serine/threonine protein kinase